MKNFLLLPLLLIGVMSFGQNPRLGLQSIEAVDKVNNYVEAEMIFQKIKELFVKTNRFMILDRESLGIVLDEQEIQKQIGSINAEVVKQGQIEGAQHIIGGKLLSLEYKEIGTKILDGIIGKVKEKLKRAIFTFTVNVIDAETSQTLHTESFKVGTLNLKSVGGLTEREAFQAALNSMDDDIKKGFINEFLPEAIGIIQIEEKDGNEAEVILIHCGSTSGTEKNDKFMVYQIPTMELDGKTIERETEIAEIKVTAVEGDDLSLAKVTKGGDELLKLFNSGEKLVCKTK